MWFDSVIGFFSPKAEYKRRAYRKANNIVKRKFEGASKSERLGGWKTAGLSVNSENSAAIAILRNRSRDLVRNNPYASRGISVIQHNTVGKGIIPQIENNRLEEAWEDWAGTTACDFDGRLTFYDMQSLAMRSIAESGEVVIRKRMVEDPNSDIPFKLQLLEGDFISNSQDQFKRTEGKNRIFQGVEIDANGKKVAYHLYENHPGATGVESSFKSSALHKTIRVPVADIMHGYRDDRPGQLRGVPWLAPLLIRLKDLDDYEDAQLMRQKIAACFSVFVRDAIDVDTDLSEQEKIELGSKVEPGLIEYLPPGKDISLANPPTVENYGEYMSVNLHSIAAGLNITYESLTGDLSQVNFSSTRMGWLEMYRHIDAWRMLILNNKINKPALDIFYQGAILSGLMRESEKPKRTRWTAPRREMIDPTKEVPATAEAIRNGIKTWSEVVREQGRYPAEVAEEIASDYSLLDSKGIILDSDPRKDKQQQPNGALNNENSDS